MVKGKGGAGGHRHQDHDRSKYHRSTPGFPFNRAHPFPSSSGSRAMLMATRRASSCASTFARRVRRALRSVFGGEVGKDTVSWVWRKVKGDWDAWNCRSLADEPIVRLILDGTVVRVQLDRKVAAARCIRATSFGKNR
jgi:hypothetical protein